MFVHKERFCSLKRQNGTKFGCDQKVEFIFFHNLLPNFVEGPYESWHEAQKVNISFT